MSRSLLVVTQGFPPAAGSGVQRGAKLVKYLIRTGWHVRVVSIDAASFAEQDPSMLSDVAGAHVASVGLSVIPGVAHVAARAVPGVRRAVRAAATSPVSRPDVALLTAPDVQWAPAARELASAGIPFVVDYPDPWTVLPGDFRVFTPTKTRSRLKWAVAPRLERFVLRRAASATFATEPIRAEYARAFPDVAGTVITNGYDPEDFESALESDPETDSGQPFRLTHVGSFAGPRSPVTAARVLRAAVDRADLAPDAAELRLVGAGASDYRDQLRSELGAISLEIREWVPHAAAVEEIRRAGVLWLDAMAHLRTAATGKLYEYLAAGRPVVGLAHPDAPATQLVERSGAGRLSATEDGAVDALADVLRGGAPGVAGDPTLLATFDRRALAERMAEVLEEAIR